MRGKMKLNTTLAVSTVALLAACGGGSSGTNNEPTVQVGQQIQSGSLQLTIDRVYSNGAAVASFNNQNGSGHSYTNNPSGFESDSGSTVGDGTTVGNRIDRPVTATVDNADQVGTRYFLTLDGGNGYAASQIRTDVNGPNMSLAAFGAPLTSVPTGTVLYGRASDNAAFLHTNGTTVQLPFEFSASFENGSAALLAVSETHKIDSFSLSLDVVTGRFYGDGELGPIGALVPAKISGGLFGTNAAGVAGIVYSTDQAVPSVSANFVGSR